jgi:hypothetical protein
MRHGHVRRAKLYYLRERTGKATRIKEKVGVRRDKEVVPVAAAAAQPAKASAAAVKDAAPAPAQDPAPAAESVAAAPTSEAAS